MACSGDAISCSVDIVGTCDMVDSAESAGAESVC